MKLKKLEISGFKSFLDKSSISFPAGISAVVGPNGCGKSNIVDAIRWVMGEQSVKQLRGKSMEDVIFAGADGKSPLNMAEVSLTLVNDNGSAPEELKDFSEIMITRRQYRSGERAYFLNKQPCRLKDVHNIFWGSGMGARSYAVIQQGNIGAITDAGPEERRFFIEEAAGVTRYKNRKNEALRKVNATNQNLLRISDIISEVKRQMGSLKRQATKAEQYRKHQLRLRDFEILVAGHYFDDYARQIEETDALLAELRDSNLAHASQLTRLDAAVEMIKLERARKSNEISAQKSQRFEAQRTTDKLENDLSYLKKELETTTNEIGGLESVRSELDGKNQQIAVEIQQVAEEMRGLEERITSEKELLDRENRAAGEMSENLSRLRQEQEEDKKGLMSLVAEEARYKNIYQNASNNKESLKRRLKRVDEEEAVARSAVSQAEKRKSEGEAALESVRRQKETLGGTAREVETALDEKGKALGQQVRTVQQLELERNKTKSELSTLMKMEQNFEWYKDGVRAVMKREKEREEGEGAESAVSSGILGVMADIIEPEPGFETAVEAILGESMQYVLVQDQDAGADSIHFLQAGSAGRSGFVPVSKVRISAKIPEKAPERSEMLFDRVRVKAGFESVARSFLSHVLVTDDLETAVTLWNQSNGSGPLTIVSKNGDVVSANGAMVGGSQDRLAGILVKKQEIKSLEKRLGEVDQQLANERQRQSQLEAEVRSLEVELQQLIAQLKDLERAETDAEKERYRITEELKHARRHLEITQLEQEQLLGEESDIDDEMARYNKALSEIEQEVVSAQQRVAAKGEDVSALAEGLEEHHQKVMDVKLRLTSLNAKNENCSHTLRRLREFQEDGVKRLEQLKQEIVQKRNRQTQTREKIQECDQRLPELYEAVQRIDQELELNEADFQAIDAKLQENDSIISKIQIQREETLEKIRYLELEQSQRQMKQENITKRLEEKYHSGLEKLRAGIGEDLLDEDLGIEELEREVETVREAISKIGEVNLAAINEYEELKQRHEFLMSQREDLIKALDDLQKVIRKINRITQDRFMNTFHAVNEKLKEVFPRLFSGGTAKLVLTDPQNPLETGVEFMIHPPGKKLTRLSLMSGGEKALSAIAFIFSIFLIKPAAFCLMDEIDAPLDEANVYRFNELLKIIGEKSQVVMITHNKKTMEFADVLFGVTMEKKGISKIVSVNFERPN